MEWLLSFFIGAIGYRLSGSQGAWFTMLTGVKVGTALARLFWAIPMALLVTALTGNIYMLGTAPLFYIGRMLGYWGGEFDLENPDNRNPKNYAILTARGAFIALPFFIATTLGGGGIAAGFYFVPFYLLGIQIQNRVKFLSNRIPYLCKFSEYGEFLLGGSIALGVALTVRAHG